jgi:hypothetical protein
MGLIMLAVGPLSSEKGFAKEVKDFPLNNESVRFQIFDVAVFYYRFYFRPEYFDIRSGYWGLRKM